MEVLDAGAEVDKQDRRKWSALMWATTNSQPQIVRLLLDNGASPDVKTGAGRTALDFLGNDDSNREIEGYLRRQSNGNDIGSVGVGEDWYDRGGFGADMEEQFAESERKRRMMMESAFNLEVDLSSLGLDEPPEVPNTFDIANWQETASDEDMPSFVWERCLPDQMFVYTESDLPALLDVVITKMLPQRSTAQKPIPANFIFLAARYAHYYQNADMLNGLFEEVIARIEKVVNAHPDDMTIHAFWISNTLLLLHYLKKDPGLIAVSQGFQVRLSECLQEAYHSLLRDSERRMSRVLDSSMLENETIQGLDELTFGDEWRLFRSRGRAPKSPDGPNRRALSPRRRAEPSPRNITSLLSSTQFILETYDIHSVIIAQCQAQLFFWLGAELFNRILSKKKFQSRSKGMQVRLNVSALEDWLRLNVKGPTEGVPADSSAHVRKTATEIGREYLGPLVQLLQWLQVLSSLGDEEDTFRRTVKALDLLTPAQLLSAATNYRAEVGEHTLSKTFKDLLRQMEAEQEEARRRARVRASLPAAVRATSSPPPATPTTPTKPSTPKPSTPRSATPQPIKTPGGDDDDLPPNTILRPSNILLPFALPTTTELIAAYGSGIGGTHREKYTPTLTPEFMEKLDSVTSKGPSAAPLGGVGRTWVEEAESDDSERALADRIAMQGGPGWGQ